MNTSPLHPSSSDGKIDVTVIRPSTNSLSTLRFFSIRVRQRTNYEAKFYNALGDVFVGKKVEGLSGFVNLMNIKSKYFDQICKFLKEDVEKNLKEFPNFKEELYEKLFSFFSRYFSDSGSVYFVNTPYNDQIYERIYTNREDVMLFWKSSKLYYAKSDILPKNMEVELDGMDISFNVSKLQHKKAWEKKELVFELAPPTHTSTIHMIIGGILI